MLREDSTYLANHEPTKLKRAEADALGADHPGAFRTAKKRCQVVGVKTGLRDRSADLLGELLAMSRYCVLRGLDSLVINTTSDLAYAALALVINALEVSVIELTGMVGKTGLRDGSAGQPRGALGPWNAARCSD